MNAHPKPDAMYPAPAASGQLTLPRIRQWLDSRRSPRRELELLHADIHSAKAEIREVLERLARKHGIPSRDVDDAMGYADDMLDDAAYAVESALEREIEAKETA